MRKFQKSKKCYINLNVLVENNASDILLKNIKDSVNNYLYLARIEARVEIIRLLNAEIPAEDYESRFMSNINLQSRSSLFDKAKSRGSLHEIYDSPVGTRLCQIEPNLNTFKSKISGTAALKDEDDEENLYL